MTLYTYKLVTVNISKAIFTSNIECKILSTRPISEKEGQDGPGSLTSIFERTIANFFLSLSEKNLQEFLYVHTVQIVLIH